MSEPDLYESIRRYAARLLSDSEAALDVAQETFLKIEQNRPEIGSERAWAYRTARNLVIDRFRKSGRFEQGLRDIPGDVTRFDPASIIEKKETLEMIQEKMNDLSPRHREVLRLKFQEGLKYAEIADVIGETHTTVGWLLHEAIQKLRKELVSPTAMNE